MIFILIFFVAMIMTTAGKGGGIVYVPLLAITGLALDDSIATSQVIILLSASVSMLVFNKRKAVDWKLVAIAEPFTAIAAAFGGYLSSSVNPMLIKVLFITSLSASLIFMKRGLFKRKSATFMKVSRDLKGIHYSYSAATAIVISTVAGFIAGLVGIAGGSIKVPLFIGICGIPPIVAVGSSSIMILITAIGSLSGQLFHSNIDLYVALPFAAVAMAGNFVGGRLSFIMKEKLIKFVILLTSIIAIVMMLFV